MKINLSERDKALIKRTVYFAGMPDRELDFALGFYQAAEKTYKAGEYLIKLGKAVPAFGIVLGGIVQVYMDDAEGMQMIMASNSPGDSFGESLAFLGTKESPVYIKAVEDARVLWLKLDRILSPVPGKCSHDYVMRVMDSFARRALDMNNRIQVLSKRSLRQKLMTLLSQCRQKSGNKIFNVPLSREDMAVYLGCDRSALSRELSNMKKEGIIDYYRNSFKIL